MMNLRSYTPCIRVQTLSLYKATWCCLIPLSSWIIFSQLLQRWQIASHRTGNQRETAMFTYPPDARMKGLALASPLSWPLWLYVTVSQLCHLTFRRLAAFTVGLIWSNTKLKETVEQSNRNGSRIEHFAALYPSALAQYWLISPNGERYNANHVGILSEY